MSGGKSFLRSGTRVVIDTHIYSQAMRDEQSQREDSPYLRFFSLLAEVCPQAVHGQKLTKEISHHLRLNLRRPNPQAFPSFLKELDDSRKFRKLPSSRCRELSEKERQSLAKKGHDNITDDRHLFEIARSIDNIVVTEDENILNQSDELRRYFGTQILDLATAIMCLESEL